ncbi:MAG TPA: HAMP domain-containing histidine kinase [Flavobacteriales bacterium]|nr:HAMP domain-containing histidine kinase [Flavobacteriales bacterium]
MKKAKLTSVIVLVTLAMVGLIAVQLYWIHNAITLKEQQFDMAVNDALGNVVVDLEKQEALNMVKGFGFETKLFNKLNRLDERIDSIEQSTKAMADSISNRVVILETKRPKAFGEHISFEFHQEFNPDSMRKGLRSMAEALFSDDINDFFNFKININDRITEMDSGQLGLEEALGTVDTATIMHKLDVVKEVMKELVLVDIQGGAHNRLDPQLIDSFLLVELVDNGINQPYEFGVFDGANMPIFEEELSKNEKKVSHSRYKVNLFPGSLVSDPAFLKIRFPAKHKYLLKTMWGILSLSGLLTMVIILSFYYTVRTIKKQKQDSDIKSDFINNMTHELKTPISTIALACEAISDEDLRKSDDQMNKYMSMIDFENKRLGNLVEDVLQSAALDKETFEIKIEEINVNDIIGAAVEKMKLLVEKNGGKISTDLSDEVGILHGDGFHLANAISNLIDNANKYCDKSPEITVRSVHRSEGVAVICEDNGIGISKGDQKKIFDKLYRVPMGNIHNVKGFGLGLNYVQAIVGKHNGNIQVISEPGKGSRFEIFIPYDHGKD